MSTSIDFKVRKVTRCCCSQAISLCILATAILHLPQADTRIAESNDQAEFGKVELMTTADLIRSEHPAVPTTGQPLISVVMPVRNGEQFLEEALQSAFQQTYKNIEIIVVDDGSTDGTLAILESFGDRLQLVRQEHRGNAAARNRGAAQASGSWIAVLDADDIWEPGKLEQQMKLRDRGEVLYTNAVNFGDCESVGQFSLTADHIPEGKIFDELVRINFITHSSVLIRRDIFLEAGGYDETLKTTCDWDLYLRIAAAGGRFCGVAEPLTRYRWRNQSTSKNHTQTCRDRLTVVRRALDSARGRLVSDKLRQQSIAEVWFVSAFFAAKNDEFQALRWYLRALWEYPLSLQTWKEIVRCGLHTLGISRAGIRRLLNP